MAISEYEPYKELKNKNDKLLNPKKMNKKFLAMAALALITTGAQARSKVATHLG